MVCKEDVLLWFKDLESYKRIDVMYELLNMCIPFEVRFLGSCIEEIGKHTFQELRGPSIIANDVERLTKDPTLHQGLLEETTRHRAVIYMSVLSARNCSCANWFYRTLFRTERLENFVNGCCKDESILSELLLLFTLCLYHPAFTFEQKIYFGKLVEKLIAQSEGNKYNAHNFLPGCILDSPRSLSSLPLEALTVPVKTSSIMPGGDTLHIQNPPPGLPPPPHALTHPPIDFIPPPIIGRTTFPATVVGAPEVHPFPPQPVSPLVSQTTSPPHSRATSPHRTFNMRPLSATGLTLPPPLLPTIHPGDSIPSAPPLLMDPPINSQTPSLPYNSPPEIITIKNNEEDVNHIADDKLRDIPWINQSIYDPTKQPNGIRMYQKYSFVTDQMQGLKLEGDNSLHCSSSASSNSSINQSPTETPSVTPAVTPHGPGRGADSKSRVNGMPQFICDINAPPPPPFSNCTVPSYSISHVPQNRYYAQTYRPHFTTPFPYQQNEVYTVPSYLIYSSMIPPPPPRNPNCYNCGGMGHSGVDCNGHTVEDITQKPYMLEYDSPTLPDNPPDK